MTKTSLKRTDKFLGGPDYLLSGSPKATRGSPRIIGVRIFSIPPIWLTKQ